jgi:hypothetical protein
MVRTWLLAYTMDQTLSAQLGKPSSMRGESSVTMYSSVLPNAGDGVKLRGEEALLDAAVICWTVSGTAFPNSLASTDHLDTSQEWAQILARALDIFRSDGSHDNAGGSVGSQDCYPE